MVLDDDRQLEALRCTFGLLSRYFKGVTFKTFEMRIVPFFQTEIILAAKVLMPEYLGHELGELRLLNVGVLQWQLFLRLFGFRVVSDLIRIMDLLFFFFTLLLTLFFLFVLAFGVNH